MKYRYIFFLFLLLPLACTKDQAADGCASCFFRVVNATPYPVDVKRDGVIIERLPSAGYMSLKVHGEALIEGDIITDFAHTDYRQTVVCPDDCAETVVIVKM